MAGFRFLAFGTEETETWSLPDPAASVAPDPIPPPPAPLLTLDLPVAPRLPDAAEPPGLPPAPAPSEDPAALVSAAARPGGGGGGGGGGTLLTSYTALAADGTADTAQFNIRVDFKADAGTKWTVAQQTIVTRVADYLSGLVAADVKDVVFNGVAIDDIAITVVLGALDGVGGQAARTTIKAYRDASDFATGGDTRQIYLPCAAEIRLDKADFGATFSELRDEVVAHEMLHTLGFNGLTFGQKGLLNAAGDFIGANAVAAYGAASVPVEDSTIPGTGGEHWDEARFAPGGTTMPDELMTGFLDPTRTALLSDVTLGALRDIGYVATLDPSPGAAAIPFPDLVA